MPSRPLILDVRSPDEFRTGHAEGAVNIPVQDLPARLAELGNPGTEVLVYCRSGARASIAADLLRRSGHRVENCTDQQGVEARLAREASDGTSPSP